MAVVLGSCSVHVYCHYLKCPDLYDKVYDYFILITQTNVLQSIMEKKKKKRKLPKKKKSIYQIIQKVAIFILIFNIPSYSTSNISTDYISDIIWTVSTSSCINWILCFFLYLNVGPLYFIPEDKQVECLYSD